MELYREVVDILSVEDLQFSCFIADRLVADPVARFGSSANAYPFEVVVRRDEKLAEQLLIGSIARND